SAVAYAAYSYYRTYRREALPVDERADFQTVPLARLQGRHAGASVGGGHHQAGWRPHRLTAGQVRNAKRAAITAARFRLCGIEAPETFDRSRLSRRARMIA
ncbi:MAG: hypothetical protein R3184_16095, partial [Aurantimonas coralicida]|nr:hypothetical protein [Aurantimonas coralicida]